jgi:3-oxoacyl-[acyl-carrier protein] reductase
MVSSISGERGSFDPMYAASKAALIGFVKSLATWLAPGVRTNALAPALIAGSRMHDDMAPERREHHRSATPTGRLTTPQEVAAVLFNLCEPAWSNLNGQVIRINGGAHV